MEDFVAGSAVPLKQMLAMLQQPVRVADLARATLIDLLRILDYPAEFVPVVSRQSAVAPSTPAQSPAGMAPAAPAGPRQPAQAASPARATLASEPINVVDKPTINAQLAQSYVTELMDRAHIA